MEGAKVTVKAEVKLPTTRGKDATFAMQDGVVEIRTPFSWGYPKVTLEELEAAVGQLREAAKHGR